MTDRLEILRNDIDRLIYKKQPGYSRYFINHLYGVSKFCVLIALKRGLDPEIAATCGMLHDIYQVTDGTTQDHAIRGAEIAGQMLKATKQYSDEEINVITAAISVHNKKRKIHGPYEELLKDADVLDHCFYNPGYSVLEKEVDRYNSLVEEFGLE
ncbi:MAG: HD domain-containing protein [Oscillospiraceae bacterium]|nr:HD domain-containing protein [Oscillospiraceae bacterium]